jgi:multicomponent Na+:H+ antiporter subunit E
VVLRSLSLGIVLAGLWLLLSGHYGALLLTLGIVSVIFVTFIAHRMDVVDHEGHPIHLGWRASNYFLWLGWEIFKANIDVARIILDPKLPISPTLVRVPSTQKTALGHVIYANSITLTPGTVTMDIVNGELDVHALTRGAADELETGRMDRRATLMEGEPDLPSGPQPGSAEAAGQ